MKTIKQTLLHYQKGTSNKVYNVYLVELSRGSYLVNFEYGRTGGNLKEGTKTTSPVSLEKAQKTFDTLVNSKIKKEYTVDAGFDSSTGKEKKERELLSSFEYKTLLLERLKRAGEIETTESSTTRAADGATGFRALHRGRETVTTVTNCLKKVDNYEVSRLIYRAGELKVEGAKELIVALYEKNTNEENAFYYAVAWALGRYRDVTLRGTIESLRYKLKEASRYIVEEALFALNEVQERRHIEALQLPMPFEFSLKNENHEKFINQIELLSGMIESTYTSYKDADANWNNTLRDSTRRELMPLLSKVDEIYLKLYMLAVINEKHHELMMKIIHFLPLTEFNFSLFRRLYKMAEFREDHVVLAELITKIESKKLACYQSYDYKTREYKSTIGCSRIYFKKRSLRYMNNIVSHDEEGYLKFATAILLSVNEYDKDFASFKTEYYDNNWNRKIKKHDAYSMHLTFMNILYGAGKRYMLAPSKKIWETANQSIKDEHRPEIHKELWDKNPQLALDILSKSRLKEVQKFAFAIIEEHPEVIALASLEQLLPLLNSSYEKVQKFFFELLKKRYADKKETIIIKTALFSDYATVVDYALEMIVETPSIIEDNDLIADSIWKIKEQSRYEKFVTYLNDSESSKTVVFKILKKVDNLLSKSTKNRIVIMLKKLISGVRIADIEGLLREDKITEQHYLALEIIRYKDFLLELPLALKEKIAMQADPEMLATTIYLLGKLSSTDLMAAHEMLINFLYHEEKAVFKEARNIIENLAKNQEDGAVLLRAIVEKSFSSTPDEVAQNISMTVKNMKASYGAIEPDQLYRMLIAKSKLSVALGSLILGNYKATDFSVVQWARMAKNPNKKVRLWAYDAYMKNVALVKEAMPKSLMIFDSAWEDTRVFACKYFESFSINTNEIVVIADSNYVDVQAFAKKMIEQGEYDIEMLLTKLSQHPALSIQKFVTDLMLGEMTDEQLLKMERFFNTLLHSINQNRVAKTRTMHLLKKRLENPKIAAMVGRLASHHSATMVWSDKEVYVEMMTYISEHYEEITLPLNIVEIEKKELV